MSNNKYTKWLEMQGINSNLTTYAYVLEDSYQRKEELKQLGYRWNGQLKIWVSPIPIGINGEVKIELSNQIEGYVWGGAFLDSTSDFIKHIIELYRPKVESKSQYIGEPKEKIERNVIVKSFRTIMGKYGYTQLVTFMDAEENIFQWFTTTYPDCAEGDNVTISATLKEHKEYKGVKQNIITRCKIIKE